MGCFHPCASFTRNVILNQLGLIFIAAIGVGAIGLIRHEPGIQLLKRIRYIF